MSPLACVTSHMAGERVSRAALRESVAALASRCGDARRIGLDVELSPYMESLLNMPEDYTRAEPTPAEIGAVEQYRIKKLAIDVKAQHRRRVFTGRERKEPFSFFASRILARRIDVPDDCTEAELLRLRKVMNS